ncbi:hypothetical protein MKZ38_005756 [Zalerion maritima]|uniref:Uncharacterized protein n=1 Tax=Zalerion maritima TaxID=339359 RepID=A0AAD5RJP9_9PEZI|nr:hypothetical protein MKZ38_005756 [Zalerion maritima]
MNNQGDPAGQHPGGQQPGGQQPGPPQQLAQPFQGPIWPIPQTNARGRREWQPVHRVFVAYHRARNSSQETITNIIQNIYGDQAFSYHHFIVLRQAYFSPNFGPGSQEWAIHVPVFGAVDNLPQAEIDRLVALPPQVPGPRPRHASQASAAPGPSRSRRPYNDDEKAFVTYWSRLNTGQRDIAIRLNAAFPGRNVAHHAINNILRTTRRTLQFREDHAYYRGIISRLTASGQLNIATRNLLRPPAGAGVSTSALASATISGTQSTVAGTPQAPTAQAQQNEPQQRVMPQGGAAPPLAAGGFHNAPVASVPGAHAGGAPHISVPPAPAPGRVGNLSSTQQQRLQDFRSGLSSRQTGAGNQGPSSGHSQREAQPARAGQGTMGLAGTPQINTNFYQNLHPSFPASQQGQMGDVQMGGTQGMGPGHHVGSVQGSFDPQPQPQQFQHGYGDPHGHAAQAEALDRRRLAEQGSIPQPLLPDLELAAVVDPVTGFPVAEGEVQVGGTPQQQAEFAFQSQFQFPVSLATASAGYDQRPLDDIARPAEAPPGQQQVYGQHQQAWEQFPQHFSAQPAGGEHQATGGGMEGYESDLYDVSEDED